MKRIDMLTQAQNRRQAAIDYLIKNPGAIATDVINHVGWKGSTGSSILCEMARDFELRREPTEVMVNNHAKLTYMYWAIVEKTRSAESHMDKITKSARMKRPPPPPRSDKHNKWVGGVYRNDPGDREPIKNQRGQGAIASGPRFATYLEAMA